RTSPDRDVLQEEEDRAGDRRPTRADAGLARRPVRALDELRVLRVVQEARDRVEEVSAVREAAERLGRVGRVVLEAGLDRVIARDEREDLVELQKSLSLTNGPPSVRPYCCWSKSYFGAELPSWF